MVVDEEELINRMLNRAEDSGRLDDNEEIIHKRMDVYRKHTRLLKDYYEKQHKVSYISGMAPVKVVSERIAQVIDYFRKNNEILNHIGLAHG
jgi:adenylate kinase